MKADIHPEYIEARVTCSCGNTFTTRSTKATLSSELCNGVPPVLHGQAEAGRQRRAHREVREALRPSAAPPPSSRRALALDPERRSQLLAVKLGVLARDHLGLADGEPTTFPGGAAVRRGPLGGS